MQRYRTIVADPPWPYDNFATMPGNANKRGHVVKREAQPYDALSVDDICGLPVRPLAEDDAALWLWTTNKYLPMSFAVMGAWGFAYRQTFVWHKTGNPSPFGGTAAPNHAEFLLLAVMGSPKFERNPSNVLAVPKPYAHSAKPEAFLDMVERVSPSPRLELFARRNRLGWDTWGNEALNHVEMTT